MSKTWYEVSKWGKIEITPVEVVRETEKQITIRRGNADNVVAKVSSYSQYFPTRAEAKAHIIERTQTRLRRARAEVVGLEQDLQKAEKL